MPRRNVEAALGAGTPQLFRAGVEAGAPRMRERVILLTMSCSESGAGNWAVSGTVRPSGVVPQWCRIIF
jgi:hypothetical protein